MESFRVNYYHWIAYRSDDLIDLFICKKVDLTQP
jgi:hypothetical protein